MNCPECNTSLNDDITTCPTCGANVAKDRFTSSQTTSYHCDKCGEELEFISAYRKWYCYNCQIYLNFPPPGEPVIKKQTAEISKVTVKSESKTDNEIIESSMELGSEEDMDRADSVDGVDVGDEKEDAKAEDGKEDADDSDQINDDDISYDENELHENDNINFFEMNEDTVEWSGTAVELETDEIIDNPIIKLGESSIEEVSEEEVEIEFEELSESNEELIFEPESIEELESPDLKNKAMAKLHAAWIKLDILLTKYPSNQQLQSIETELKEAMKGNISSCDVLILAEDNIDEIDRIDKELQQNIFSDVSTVFHFVNSKIAIARKIGFEVGSLEDAMDNVSSYIAMGKFSEASKALHECLLRIRALPDSQGDLVHELTEKQEQLTDMLEPLPGKKV